MDKATIAKEIFMNTLGRRIKTNGVFPFREYRIEYVICEGHNGPLSLEIRLINKEGEVETGHANFQDELLLLSASFYENISFKSNECNLWFYPSEESMLYNKRIRDLDLKSFVVFCSQMEEEAQLIAKEFGEIIKMLECFSLEKVGWPHGG